MKTNLVYLSLLVCLAGLVGQGCGKSTSPNSKASSATPQTTHGAPIKATFSDLAIPPKPEVTPEFLAHGKKVYDQNCLACHGIFGDGKGPASGFLLPRPRNFQEAKYRLRTTPSGQLPTDTDLYRSVSFGMAGTPMPPWRHVLNENDRWAVVEYIKSFSPRFNDPTEKPGPVLAVGPRPNRSEHTVQEGKTLYTQLGCAACHGESGKGDGASAASLVDDSGTKIKPRDLSNPGAFKAGYAGQEIVRSILTGLDGTPMPGFHGTIAPEQAWKVAYYVESLARPAALAATPRASQNFLVREELGEPDVRIRVTERAWQFDPAEIRVKKGQVVEITFEPTDNGLGVGHGFAISSYDEVAFLNGVMVGAPKNIKFRADRAGKFTYYCSTQCSTDKLHPLMHGTLYVEDLKQTASVQ